MLRTIRHRRHPLAVPLVLSALGLVAGCAGEQEAPAADTSAQAARSGPTQGGSLVIVRAADSTTLDPADIFEGESTKVAGQVFDTLVQFKPGATEVEPALAERWESGEGGRVWTFHLRDGVRFHDGTPLDADAVVFSIARQMDPDHPFHEGEFSIWHNTFEGHITAVEAVDPRTVRVTLNEPFAPILTGFAVYSMSIVSPTAMEEMGVEGFSRQPVGSGPFRFVEWAPGDRIVLAANDDYWGGRPYLDEVVFRSVPDAAERSRLLTSGEAHVVEGLDQTEIAGLQQAAGVAVKKKPGLNTGYLAFNTTRRPFDDPKVRQAIAHAVDVPTLARVTFQELGVPAKNYLPPTLWGANAELGFHSHDAARAQQLLAEAGLPEGFTFTLDVMRNPRPYMPQPLKVANMIQSQLAEVGITVEIRENEWPDHLQRVVRGGEADYEAALLGWMADMPDPNDFLSVQYHSANADLSRPHQNIALYRNPRVDQLVEQAQRVSDRAERARLYRDVQTIVHEDVPLLPLAHSFVVIAHRSSVHGLAVPVTSSNYGLDGVWLAGAGGSPAAAP